MKKFWFFIPCIALVLIAGSLWIRHYMKQPKSGYLQEKPIITLTCGNKEYTPEGWCLGWDIALRDGTGLYECSSYPDPLSNEANHPVLSLQNSKISYRLSAASHSIRIERWPTDVIGAPHPESESVIFETETPQTGSFNAEIGFLYCITASWKNGAIHYYFITE